MNTLLCATTNEDKFAIGKSWFLQHGIVLEQVIAEIDEIQGEDPEAIIRDKARRAFEYTGEPTIVTDDCWNIPALNGFPGPYMKSVNHWLSPEKLLSLLDITDDRTIILQQLVAYQDEIECVVFRKDILGKITHEPRGSYGPASAKLIAFDTDNGKTISEIHDLGITGDPARLAKRQDAWEELAIWYAKKITL